MASHWLRALVPIAVGHAVWVALVAAAVLFGLAMDRVALQILAGALLVVLAIVHRSRRTPKVVRAPAGHAGLALWSFTMAGAHGAGLMLVPALIPLCTVAGPAAETGASDALLPALAALGVHTAAMLVSTGAIALAACRGLDAGARWLKALKRERTPPSALHAVHGSAPQWSSPWIAGC
jgi:hypothetical protein